MALDASIYQNAQPLQPQASPMQLAQQAMTLKSLGYQNQQQQLALDTQQAMRQAFQNNSDGNGGINRQGVLSDIGKVNPTAAIQLGQQWNAMDKANAEKQQAQVASLHSQASIAAPTYGYALRLYQQDPTKAAAAWPQLVHQLSQQGIDISNLPTVLNASTVGTVQRGYDIASQYKEQADVANTQAQTAKTYSDIGLVPLQKQNEQFGTRSANAELSDQYIKDVSPIRNSQLFMNQMLDSYKNKTPQGDAALVLNNFKIRNPQAVDVNSIEEMKSSQAVPDAWKNKLNEALSGGFDENTRNNLIRDGISAFRANYGTYQGIAQKYQDMAKARGVNLGGMTNEPAMQKTYGEAMDLQKAIGPYIPPTQRGGSILGSISNMIGMGGPKSANAAQAPKYRPTGAPVSADEVAQYATRHGMKLSDAQNFLRSQGYAIGNR